MYLLLFLAYVVAEIAVLAWLGSTLGALVTVLLFLGVSVLGYAVLASRGRRALRDLTSLRGGATPNLDVTPERMLTDGALIGVGAALVLVPGLITSILGIVLLLPTRAVLRPLVRAAAARQVARHGATVRGTRTVVVDGQVVEHTVVGADPRLTAPGPSEPVIPSDGVLEGEIVDTPPRRHP
ncbi:FxsA family protein [Rhodococcus artemisiae]|uniref:FxsA family protein n=1 Tax=Rhodococcus artemisiae TaxID=714159 RepID=A0ABU7LJZ5_9NOCA|nr:FxsA family protein [Rhodococcus artemisiae]MEE2061888.1 FxsA family protein [Rhodococcus artemisiae]